MHRKRKIRHAPDSLKALYIIAWKYIIRDFYRVRLRVVQSPLYTRVRVLESTLMRFTTLVRGNRYPA